MTNIGRRIFRFWPKLRAFLRSQSALKQARRLDLSPVEHFIPRAQAAVDVAMIRSTPGGENLQPEMLLLLALVVFDDYELFPSRSHDTPKTNP